MQHVELLCCGIGLCAGCRDALAFLGGAACRPQHVCKRGDHSRHRTAVTCSSSPSPPFNCCTPKCNRALCGIHDTANMVVNINHSMQEPDRGARPVTCDHRRAIWNVEHADQQPHCPMLAAGVMLEDTSDSLQGSRLQSDLTALLAGAGNCNQAL